MIAIRSQPIGGHGNLAAILHDVRFSVTAHAEGWGVHYVPGRGWTYNLLGFDCVELTVGGRTIRIGTDDADGLEAFLQRRCGV